MTGALRVVLGLVALANAATGAQAALAPRAFFGDFPAGRGWVAALPPYNEHLTTDVGAFFLGFAVLFAWAAWRPRRELVLPLVAAWTVTGLVHLAFHVTHLDGFGPADAAAQTAGLVAVLAPALLAVPALRRGGDRCRSAPAPRGRGSTRAAG